MLPPEAFLVRKKHKLHIVARPRISFRSFRFQMVLLWNMIGGLTEGLSCPWLLSMQFQNSHDHVCNVMRFSRPDMCRWQRSKVQGSKVFSYVESHIQPAPHEPMQEVVWFLRNSVSNRPFKISKVCRSSKGDKLNHTKPSSCLTSIDVP